MCKTWVMWCLGVYKTYVIRYIWVYAVCVECCICILCEYVQCVSMCGVCVQFMECVGVWGGVVLGIWVYMYCVVM